MKKYMITGLAVLLTIAAQAQTTMDEVLRQVETNNRELQAARQYYELQLLESKSENNLPDPSVSYSHQYGNRAEMGVQGELVASQSFEFPTVYGQRSKLTTVRQQLFASQYTGERRQVLLNAQEVCLDLVWLNRRRQLLRERRRDAERLAELYDERLKKGNANILETNKIKLELLNVKTEERLNETEREGKLRELATLNGGHPVAFTDTVYPSPAEPSSWDALRDEALAADATLQTLQYRQAEAQRQIGVSRAQGLPGLELGYRLNTATGGDRYNGFVVGMSIPLFSNRHQVKKAHLQSHYVELQRESAAVQAKNRLMQLYHRLQVLRASMDEFDTVLKNQDNLNLLNKALQAGQISMIEYFVSIGTLYQSTDYHLQLQSEYHKVLAAIYSYKL